MSTVQPTDKVLVHRAGTNYSTPADMSTVQDSDLLLINRAGTDYKCTFLDWKNSQAKAPDINTAVLTEDDPAGDRFTSQAFTTTVTMVEDGIPASTKGIKGWVEGTLSSTIQTDTITQVDTGANQEVDLTFASDKDLSKLQSGDYIEQNDFAAEMDQFDLVVVGNDDPDPNRVVKLSLLKVYVNGTQLKDGATNYSSGIFAGQIYDGGPFNPSPTSGSRIEDVEIGWDFDDFFDPKTMTSFEYEIEPGAAGVTIEVDVRAGGFTIGKLFVNGTQRYNMMPFVNTQDPFGGAGTVGSVDVAGNSLTLASSTGTWGPANAGHYAIGPTKTVTNAKLYTVLDAGLNVTDLQSADPGFTTFTGLTPKITFPALLPSGQAPDIDLPAGTTIQAEVEATNPSGTDTQVSTVATPA